MREHILVSLDCRDRIHEIIPYLDKIAKPGMRVVFLVRRSATNWPWMAAHLAAIQTGNWLTLSPTRAALESAERSVERQLKDVGEALRRKGLQMEIKVYDGSFRKIVVEFAQRHDVRFVMMPASFQCSWFRVLRLIAHNFKLPKRSRVSPVLLFYLTPMDGTLR